VIVKQIIIVVLFIMCVSIITIGVSFLFKNMKQEPQQTTITSSTDEETSVSSTPSQQHYEYYIRDTPVVGAEGYICEAMNIVLPDGYEVINYTEYNRWGDFYVKIKIEKNDIPKIVRQLKSFGAQEDSSPSEYNYDRKIEWWDVDVDKVISLYGRAILRTDDGFIYKPMGTYPEGYGLVLMLIFFTEDDDGTCYMYIRSQ